MEISCTGGHTCAHYAFRSLAVPFIYIYIQTHTWNLLMYNYLFFMKSLSSYNNYKMVKYTQRCCLLMYSYKIIGCTLATPIGICQNTPLIFQEYFCKLQLKNCLIIQRCMLLKYSFIKTSGCILAFPDGLIYIYKLNSIYIYNYINILLSFSIYQLVLQLKIHSVYFLLISFQLKNSLSAIC